MTLKGKLHLLEKLHWTCQWKSRWPFSCGIVCPSAVHIARAGPAPRFSSLKEQKRGCCSLFLPSMQIVSHGSPSLLLITQGCTQGCACLGLPSSWAPWTPGRNKAIFRTGDFLCSQAGISIVGLFILAQRKARRQISWLTTWGDWLKHKTSSGCCYGYCFWLQEILFLLSNNDLAGLGRPARKRVEGWLITVQRLRMMVHAMVMWLH